MDRQHPSIPSNFYQDTPQTATPDSASPYLPQPSSPSAAHPPIPSHHHFIYPQLPPQHNWCPHPHPLPAPTAPSPLSHDRYLLARKRRLTFDEPPHRRPSQPTFHYRNPASHAGVPAFASASSHVASSTMHPSPASPQHAPVPGSSMSTAIDLTQDTSPHHLAPNRALPPSYPTSSQQPYPVRPEHLPPRWQPDSEAPACQVCETDFTFFFRKHHCRRCGRVVCANCSPHRITLPRQYIVQPPQNPVSGGDDLFAVEEAMWGGEEVRVCNPCVPDPNLNPPNFSTLPRPPQHPDQPSVPRLPYSPPWPISSHTFDATAAPASPGVWVGRSGRAYDWSTRPPSHRQSLSTTNTTNSQHHPLQGLGYRVPQPGSFGIGPSSQQGSIRPPPYYLPNTHALSHPAVAQDLVSFLNSQQSQPSNIRDIPASQRSLVAEEDECPICGEELPPVGSNGDTTDREGHVENCIKSHMYSASAPQGSTGQLSSTPSRRVHGQQDSSGTSTPAEPSSSKPRRMTGGRMLVYTATEKDCTGEDGVTQECVICLEDFEVGSEMARLECLCKFHRKCIRDWWETKGAGSCPTHQLHD